MNVMKTIYAITTREFPIHNNNFQNVTTGDIVIRNWSKHFKASLITSWKSNDSLSLKCYNKDGMILYVAPSLIDLLKKDPKDYVNDVLEAIIEDISNHHICDEEYQIFLIAHDADLGTKEILFRLKTDNANDEILMYINPICCGYMTFKHASMENKEKHALQAGIEGEVEYDIFDNFIDWLDAENFDTSVCVNLEHQLIKYGLK